MVNSITAQLKEFFQSKGMQLLEKSQTENENNKDKPELILSDNVNKIYVKVINNESMNERNKLLNSIMKSVGYLIEANIVYLVLPKLYASILDGAIFRENGLGLITYDDGGSLQEIIQPKIFPTRQMSESGPSKIYSDLINEINYLKDSLHSLELEVNMLKNSINDIRINQNDIEIKPQVSKVLEKPRINSADFPEFMRDNPWIEILSRRGKE